MGKETNYPDPDKKMIFFQDWFRFFGKDKKRLDTKEDQKRED